MSRIRHSKGGKARASGGHVESASAADAGVNPHIASIAKDKTGIGYVDGSASKGRLDRKCGGKASK